jgi:hypothetical protein
MRTTALRILVFAFLLSTALDSQQGSNVKLHYNWTAGKSYSVTNTIVNKSHLEGNDGSRADVEINSVLTTSWKVSSVAADGRATIEVEYKIIRATALNNGQQLWAVDTQPTLQQFQEHLKTCLADKRANCEKTDIEKLYGSLIGGILTLKINALGEVIEVAGAEQIADRMRDALELAKLPPEKRAQMDQLMEALLTTNAAPATFSPALLPLPPGPVTLNSTWKQMLEFPMPGQKISLVRVFRLTGANDPIEVEGNVSMDVPPGYNLNFASDPGKNHFDMKLGMVADTQYGFTIKRPLMIESNGKMVEAGQISQTTIIRFKFDAAPNWVNVGLIRVDADSISRKADGLVYYRYSTSLPVPIGVDPPIYNARVDCLKKIQSSNLDPQGAGVWHAAEPVNDQDLLKLICAKTVTSLNTANVTAVEKDGK